MLIPVRGNRNWWFETNQDYVDPQEGDIIDVKLIFDKFAVHIVINN